MIETKYITIILMLIVLIVCYWLFMGEVSLHHIKVMRRIGLHY